MKTESFSRKEVSQAILASHAFIFILSSHSVSSPHCQEEVQFACDNNIKIYPITKEKKLPEKFDEGLDMLLQRFQYMNFSDAFEEQSQQEESIMSMALNALIHKKPNRAFDAKLGELADILIKSFQEKVCLLICYWLSKFI